MADNWDDEDHDAEEVVVKPAATDAWSGEDEDDDVKDNWEDSDDGEKPAAVTAPTEKKKPLKERIAEREAKKKAELVEKRRKEEEARQQMTPEEVSSEKERLRVQEEEDQLMLAKELMGVSLVPTSGIDAMNPQTPEEFTEFATKLKKKISECESHLLYSKFLEDLFRDLCATLNSENIKRIGGTLSTLGIEKHKVEKAKDGGKGKKKGKGATIRQVRTDDYDEGEFDNEFEDFM